MEQQLTRVENYLRNLQTIICDQLAALDGGQHFRADAWQREQGGGGISCILEDGAVFAKAGVNFSCVHGSQMPASATTHRPELAGADFTAVGVSLVLHPVNPYAPTTHANVRFFLARLPDRAPLWWFGGGFDLTPYYGFVEDCQHWHAQAKSICQPFGSDIYPQFKHWCDDYFYLPHRNEPRGIGGLFFDDLQQWGFEKCFNFTAAVGDGFLPAYMPIVRRRKDMPFTERELQFQQYRRGRYVEFNLIYDRGTLFGLQSGGRTESILMSLPPAVRWQYNYHPEPGTPEAQLYTDFLIAKEWCD